MHRAFVALFFLVFFCVEVSSMNNGTTISSLGEQSPLIFNDERIVVESCEALKSFLDTHLTNNHYKERIVFCDADNTIVQADEVTGRSSWFQKAELYLKDRYGLNREEARGVLKPLLEEHCRTGTYSLVEKEWPAIIRGLQDAKTSVILVTGRAPSVALYTDDLFKRLECAFSHELFGEDETVDVDAQFFSHYRGMLHCGVHTKGRVVGHFMNKKHEKNPFIKPLVVVCIDDRPDCLEHVAQALQIFSEQHSLYIEYVGVLYTAVGEHTLTADDILLIEQTHSSAKS